MDTHSFEIDIGSKNDTEICFPTTGSEMKFNNKMSVSWASLF